MRRLDIPFHLSGFGLPGSLVAEGVSSPEIQLSAVSLRARRRCRMLARFPGSNLPEPNGAARWLQAAFVRVARQN
jgi:hypothetical protein